MAEAEAIFNRLARRKSNQVLALYFEDRQMDASNLDACGLSHRTCKAVWRACPIRCLRPVLGRPIEVSF